MTLYAVSYFIIFIVPRYDIVVELSGTPFR